MPAGNKSQRGAGPGATAPPPSETVHVLTTPHSTNSVSREVLPSGVLHKQCLLNRLNKGSTTCINIPETSQAVQSSVFDSVFRKDPSEYFSIRCCVILQHLQLIDCKQHIKVSSRYIFVVSLSGTVTHHDALVCKLLSRRGEDSHQVQKGLKTL